MRLKDKVAVISGGNSGIGLGIAKQFRAEGASGAIVGRTQHTLDAAVKTLEPNFIAVRGDVTRMDDLERLYEQTTERFGNIDVLVANAGGAVGPGTLGMVGEVDESSFDRMVNLNLKSVFFTVQKALPYLKSSASIILVSSIAAHKGFAGMSVYNACKAGVRSLARTFSAELVGRGIRVNVLTPGTIDTPVFSKLGLPEEQAEQAKKQFEKLIPLKRIGTPEEMGRIAVFLASDDSSFVVGEEIIADGGVVNL
ncbi:MAG: SDR family oxidoreductase [Nitrospirae bacterium]|nr:SDR family oxidoreductase [Nitrospirota bacterium]